jgi:hypothetical protein
MSIKRYDTKQVMFPSRVFLNKLSFPNLSPVSAAIKSPTDRNSSEVIAMHFSNKKKTTREAKRRYSPGL